MAEDQNGPHNIELVTPVAKAKVVLKPFMSGYDEEAINEALMGGYKTQIKSKQQPGAQPRDFQQRAAAGDTAGTTADNTDQIVEIDATAGMKADRKRVEVMVVSVNGDASDVVKGVYGLPSPDTNAVINKIKEILKSALGDTTPDNPDDPQDSEATREKKS